MARELVVNGSLVLLNSLSYTVLRVFTFIFHDDFVTLYFLVLCSSVNGLHHFFCKAIIARSIFANVNINLITLPWKKKKKKSVYLLSEKHLHSASQCHLAQVEQKSIVHVIKFIALFFWGGWGGVVGGVMDLVSLHIPPFSSYF